jgi:RNA polymerase sigma factor (sigma-70 family)
MRDSELVAAIVAGDPEGLAEAYDKYASPLYTYCRSLLREPADAADAVQDTFVIAASRLAGLRDRDRLRPWLYAVARNECRRRMRESAAEVISAPDEVPEVTDEAAEVGTDAEHEELRTLLRSAVRGLNSGEQDLIELQLRQGLEAGEIADVLGVSRNHAHALLSRARDQLETSLGALLVARTGREDCAALMTMLADWDGQLTVLMRKRLNRHIEQCPVCDERRRRELAPAMLLGLAPLAALPVIAAPAGLREQVLRLVGSDTPAAVAHRADVLQRTPPFGHHGFPKPVDPPKGMRWRTRQVQAAAAGAVVVAIAAAVLIALALTGGGSGHHGGPQAAGGQTSVAPGGAGRTATGTIGAPTSAAAGLPGGPGQSAQPTAPGSGGHLSPSPTAGGGGGPTPAPGTSPAPTVGPSPGSTAPAPAPSTSAPPPGRSPSPTSPAPSASSSRASPTPTPPPSPKQGTLTVSPATVLLSPLLGGSITISAAGGPVNWSVSESGSLVGKLTIAPSSGTLASGQSTSVSVSASGLASLDSQITVNPGGHPVTVLLGVNLGTAELVGMLTVNPGGHVVTIALVTRASPSPSPSPSQSGCPSPGQSTPSGGHPDGGGGGCCGGDGSGCDAASAGPAAGAGPGSFPPRHEGRLVD